VINGHSSSLDYINPARVTLKSIASPNKKPPEGGLVFLGGPGRNRSGPRMLNPNQLIDITTNPGSI